MIRTHTHTHTHRMSLCPALTLGDKSLNEQSSTSPTFRPNSRKGLKKWNVCALHTRNNLGSLGSWAAAFNVSQRKFYNNPERCRQDHTKCVDPLASPRIPLAAFLRLSKQATRQCIRNYLWTESSFSDFFSSENSLMWPG